MLPDAALCIEGALGQDADADVRAGAGLSTALFRIIGSQPSACGEGGLTFRGRSGPRNAALGSQAPLLLLHPDLGALRTFPLPLLVVDVALDLSHCDLALSTCHLYSSIAPKAYVEARESRHTCGACQ